MFWVTSEIIPQVDNLQLFIDLARHLVENLTLSGVSHEFQDPEGDQRHLAHPLRFKKEAATRPVLFITPEAGLYRHLLLGERTIEVDLSRVADIAEWKTRGHKKRFPDLRFGERDAYKVFLDSVAFTGRSVEEVHKAYGIDLAVFECLGKHAPRKLEKLGVESIYARDLSDFDAVWHLDDFVQPVQTDSGSISPTAFLRDQYPILWAGRNGSIKGCKETLNTLGIKIEQTSPNLFLEMARPESYLGRSFHTLPGKIKAVAPIVEAMEKLYKAKER